MSGKEGWPDWSIWSVFLAVALWFALPYLSQIAYQIEHRIQQKKLEQIQRKLDADLATIPPAK